MKKLIAIVALLLAMVLVLSACGKKEEEKPATPTEASKAAAPAENAGETPSGNSDAEPATLVGTWVLTQMKPNASGDVNFADEIEKFNSGKMKETITFTDTGITVFIDYGHPADNEERTLTYRTADGKILVDDFPEVDFVLSGDTLQLAVKEGTYFFTKQK